MKKLRRICAVAILCAALASSAFAGQIDSPGSPSPIPRGASITTTLILTIVGLIR